MEFFKVYSSIRTSTIWQEPSDTRIVWLTMLSLSDSEGIVSATIPGLAHAAVVSLEATEVALATFLSPDQYSRTKDHEGRRISEIDGGWMILNYKKYFDQRTKKQIQDAERQRRKRVRDASATSCDKRDMSRSSRALATDLELDLDLERDSPTENKPKAAKKPLTPSSKTEAVRLAWNIVAKDCGLPECRMLSPGRLTTLRARLKDPGWAANYPAALERLRGIRWIRGSGRYKPRPIDWFIQPDQVAKILEGLCDDNTRDRSLKDPDDSAGLF